MRESKIHQKCHNLTSILSISAPTNFTDMIPEIQPSNEANMLLPTPLGTAATVRLPEETAATTTTTKAPPTHECHDCGKVFRQASNLRTHLKVHGKSAVREFFLCSLCGRHFQYKNSLLVHLGTHQFHINSSSKVSHWSRIIHPRTETSAWPALQVLHHICSLGSGV